MNHLLIADQPLLVLPKLAERIGLDEAIFAQQLHYLCKEFGNLRDGHKWVYNTYDGWSARYRFWSPTKVRRVITNLEKLGVVVSSQKYNKMQVDNTKWYRVNYSCQLLDFSELSNLTDDLSDTTDHLPHTTVQLSNPTEQLPETTHKDYQQTTTTAPAPAETGQDVLPAAFAGSFVMPLDWQPADRDMVTERLRFSQIPALDTDLCRDAMLDFVEFWHAEPQMLRTAAQWDAAFLQSVRGYRAKRGHLYHRDGSRKDSGSLKAAAGAADYVPAVSKTEQKTAWLRETGRARLDGETSGKLKPAIFATVCEGLAQSLEAGANRGAPMLAGLPALLAAWERDLAVVLADDANGERLLRAFAALIGQSDVFPTVPALLEKLPPLLPQFRQPENRPETRQNGKRMGADEGARGQVRARLKLRGSTGGAQ